MDINAIVNSLCARYNSHDPFDIAKQRNAIVVFEPLGSIHGFYCKSHRKQVIHINQDLNDFQKFFTCGHELGHSIMHPNTNTPFLRASTYYSIDKLETQANRFAVDLIYTDDDLQPFLTRSITDAAAYMGIPARLAEYRMSTVSPQYIEDFGC